MNENVSPRPRAVRSRPRRRAGAFAAFALLAPVLLPAGPAAAVTATTADDVCPASADPCSVTTRIDVTPGATLDFGTRAVSVSGSGQFNFAANSGSIRCGNFSASTTGAAIDANGPSSLGGSAGGSVFILARRRCSGGNPKPACVDATDCQLGPCGVRRCSKKPAKPCTSDGHCQVGPCGTNKRCSGSTSFLRCSTNADCDFGACPAQLTCAGRDSDPVACAADGDCDFGSCSVGTASISLGGAVVANSDSPGTLELRAADSVSISKTVNLSSTHPESDGGEFVVEAAAGAVTVTAKLSATGGIYSQGGILEFHAATDVNLAEELNVGGGDFDGGSVEVDADRDAVISRSILANSTGGAGFGGEVLVSAGRDIVVTGGSPTNKTTIETNGHTDAEGYSGDGGSQEFAAQRNLSLGANTRLVGRGSAPEGRGGDVLVEADGDVSMNGDVTARADGAKGGGGAVEITSGGALSSTSTFDLTGGEEGGGDFAIASAGNVDLAGTVDVGGGLVGSGGSAVLDADADVAFTATWTVAGSDGGEFDVDACRITFGSGGRLDNKVLDGANRFVARENMKLLAGSTMKSGAAGTNTLVYRAAAKPPVTAGTITPAARLIVNPQLVGCPVCGNGELDDRETCDDGNTQGGDGCSASCQNENCLAQTAAPGFPAVPLCDDGKPCTDDFCNTQLNGGTCRHRARDCDDGIACTTDSCDAAAGGCLHVEVNEACTDDDVCTDDYCSAVVGCSWVKNTAPCDDGNACTQADQCTAGVCAGIPLPDCGICGDGVVGPGEACDDGNATFTNGEYCGVGCVLIPCGKPTNSSGDLPKSSDALFALRAAVGQAVCSPRVCDADGSGKVLASDALRILKAAVGQGIQLKCPSA